MEHNTKLVYLLLILVFYPCSLIYSFDGERKGAIMTFGLGAGHSTLTSGVDEFSTYPASHSFSP